MNDILPSQPIVLLQIANDACRIILEPLLSHKYKVIKGFEADALFQPFDLCIIDTNMLTNLELNILARKKEDTPFLPFLLVAGRDELPALASYIKYTVDEILLTPIDDLILQPRVETLLRTRKLVQEVQLLADFDELTGVLARRRFLRIAQRELFRDRRFDRPMSAVMLDIDHFKKVNDRHGHAVGDQVLRAVAQRCQKIIREIDIFGRYGGEEFSLVLPELDIKQAQDVAERLCLEIAQQPFEIDDGKLDITISLGITQLTPSDVDIESLLMRADEAMYSAKRAGRNQVAIR